MVSDSRCQLCPNLATPEGLPFFQGQTKRHSGQYCHRSGTFIIKIIYKILRENLSSKAIPDSVNANYGNKVLWSNELSVEMRRFSLCLLVPAQIQFWYLSQLPSPSILNLFLFSVASWFKIKSFLWHQNSSLPGFVAFCRFTFSQSWPAQTLPWLLLVSSNILYYAIHFVLLPKIVISTIYHSPFKI